MAATVAANDAISAPPQHNQSWGVISMSMYGSGAISQMCITFRTVMDRCGLQERRSTVFHGIPRLVSIDEEAAD